MHFANTPLTGLRLVTLDPIEDERGYFARTWCDREAAAAGVAHPMVQDSLACNFHARTLRGLHLHSEEFAQTRVMRCAAGEVFVAAVDLRSKSASYCRHWSTTLDAESHTALYIPPGFALGYLTLVPQTAIFYKMSLFYDPLHERGVRWNDPVFAIDWPFPPDVINERDANYDDFDPNRGLS